MDGWIIPMTLARTGSSRLEAVVHSCDLVFDEYKNRTLLLCDYILFYTIRKATLMRVRKLMHNNQLSITSTTNVLDQELAGAAA